jgi:hypothetical protein
MKGMLLVVVAILVLILGIYVAYVTTSKNLAGDDGGGSFSWASIFGVPGSKSLYGNASGTAAAPAGYSARDLSARFGHVRIQSVVPGGSGAISEVTLSRRTGGATVDVSGWTLKGKSGEYRIRPEDNRYDREFLVRSTTPFLDAARDRVRLLDEKNLLVDEYAY